MKPVRQKRNPESGFALLFVYAMAATVAIMLLMQLPSAAFEAQRDREQLLIDRGEQYSRAIQLYVRKFNRYPADFDALDNTQNQRFLRHHYEDPLAGKEEWRLIHVGPGGVFTDSLLYTKKQDPNAPAKQTFITEIPTVAQDPTGAGGVNLATRRQGNPNDPNAPFGGVPGGNFPNQNQNFLPGQTALPGQPQQGGVPGFPGQILPGQISAGQSGQFPDPNQPQQFIPGGLPPGVQLPPGTQLPPGIQNPGGQSASNPTSGAAGIINQLLTTPRPGGLGGLATAGTQQTSGALDAFGNPVATPGIVQPGGQLPGQPAGVTGQPTAAQQPAMGQTIGGGIAGVASKLEQEGIKRYRERKLYNEWEFVYDITKDNSRGGAGGTQQTAVQTGATTSPDASSSSTSGSTSGPTGGASATGQPMPGQNPTQPTQPANPPGILPPVQTPPFPFPTH